jgi:alpha-L-fucosidase
MLVSTVNGDGNLLLNIGPMPTGEFQPQEIANLKAMGRWLGKFGESIYGTRGGPYRNGQWGGSCYKDHVIYLHVFQWAGDTLELPSLKAKVLRADVLGGEPVEFTQSDAGLTLILPENRRDAIDTVIKLELNSPAENEFIDGKPLDVAASALNR